MTIGCYWERTIFEDSEAAGVERAMRVCASWWSGVLNLVLGLGAGPLVAEDLWESLPLAGAPQLTIEAKVDDGPYRRGPCVALNGKAIRFRAAGVRQGEEVRWFQIVPETGRYYKNANHPWEDNAYEWTGFGRIDYRLTELVLWRGRAEVEVTPGSDFRNASRSPYYHADVGSLWFQVQAVRDGGRLRSAGLEENGERNLSESVFRLTLQQDAGYLGTLTGFFNVPGLFGSVPQQSFHYIGVDCADVLVAAQRRWRGLGPAKDHNVSMLVESWPLVAEFPMEAGVPRMTLRWGVEILPGDAIAVRYTPGKAFQHIGALYADANRNGVLDSADEVIHAGPQALHLSRLREGGFDGYIKILRPPK